MHGGATLVSQNVMLHTMYEMRRPSFGMWQNFLMIFMINYVCSRRIQVQIMLS